MWATHVAKVVDEAKAEFTMKCGMTPIQVAINGVWEHRDFAISFFLEGTLLLENVPYTKEFVPAFKGYADHRPVAFACRPPASCAAFDNLGPEAALASSQGSSDAVPEVILADVTHVVDEQLKVASDEILSQVFFE